MKKLAISLALISSTFIGCGTVINMSEYPTHIHQKESVPSVCKNEYKNLMQVPKVAVLKFTNNSAFGKATTSTSNGSSDYSHAGVAGLAVTQNAIGVAEADKSHSTTHSNSTKRVVDPKLDKAISSALEGSLVSMGGVKIYSRSDLDKVMKEQKIQQSGLFDEKTLVQVGKLAGVKYIITGSIDSVTQKYDDYEEAGKAASKAVKSNGNNDVASQAVSAVLSLGSSAMSGMKITTRATFKVIDVTTGEIVFSKPAEETKNIGKIKNPTYTQLVGGIKDDLMESLKSLKPSLSKFFAPAGYVIQVRSNAKHKDFIAQINLGTKNGIQPEQTFKIYKFDEITDPVTNKTTCDKYTINAKLVVSKNQIGPKYSWTKVEGDDASKVRAGQIVKRDGLKNSLLSF